MKFSYKTDNFDLKINKKSGIKIVENPLNKRISDIFNYKSDINTKISILTYDQKMKHVEDMQNYIDLKLRVRILFCLFNYKYIWIKFNYHLIKLDLFSLSLWEEKYKFFTETK